MNKKAKLFIPCYYAFFANGMMALVLGSVLSYLMKEAGINYSLAGGLLSTFAIGNFMASFINPPTEKYLGKKKTSVILSMLIPIALFVITLLPPISVLYVACILLGIGRGTVSITNNRVINDYDGTPAMFNLLHTVFAIGAFLAPFLTGIFIKNGFNWRCIVITIVILSIFTCIGYALMPLEADEQDRKDQKNSKDSKDHKDSKNHKVNEDSKNSTVQTKAFLKEVNFYVISAILFFYLGTENCVNGWFVTYFKSTGIMSDTYATNLVSVTWIMIMIGRMLNAYLSKRVKAPLLILMNSIGTAIFFILLISSSSLTWITAAVVGMGFFFAGIYPTCIADAGKYIKGSTLGVSVLLAIAALGGIITPQIIGIVADHIGMTGAITVLALNVICMGVLAVTNVIKSQKE